VEPEKFEKFEKCALKNPNSVDEKCKQEYQGTFALTFSFLVKYRIICVFSNVFISVECTHLIE
jgi:hypothetical protein